MSRAIVIGLTALILSACGPADQTPTAEPAAPAPAPAPTPAPAAKPAAAAASAPQPFAPTTWEAMADHYHQSEAEPADALQALESRAVTCVHYMGEHSGMGSERDQWLNDQMDQYRCEELVAEARAMRDAHSGEPAVVARLNIILAQFEAPDYSLGV